MVFVEAKLRRKEEQEKSRKRTHRQGRTSEA